MIVIITRLFNARLRLSHLPPQWKIEKVVMLPKHEKDLLYPQNLRPISLLPTLSKVFERLLHFIYDNHLLPDLQFGFRPQFGTVAQLVRVVELIPFNSTDELIPLVFFLTLKKPLIVSRTMASFTNSQRSVFITNIFALYNVIYKDVILHQLQ